MRYMRFLVSEFIYEVKVRYFYFDFDLMSNSGNDTVQFTSKFDVFDHQKHVLVWTLIVFLSKCVDPYQLIMNINESDCQRCRVFE